MITKFVLVIFIQLISTIVIVGAIYRVAPEKAKKIGSENKALKDKIKSNEIDLAGFKNKELLFSEKISKIERQLDALKEKEKVYKKDISELEVKYTQSQSFLKNCHVELNKHGYTSPRVTIENKDFNWCNACDKKIHCCMCSN